MNCANRERQKENMFGCVPFERQSSKAYVENDMNDRGITGKRRWKLASYIFSATAENMGLWAHNSLDSIVLTE